MTPMSPNHTIEAIRIAGALAAGALAFIALMLSAVLAFHWIDSRLEAPLPETEENR